MSVVGKAIPFAAALAGLSAPALAAEAQTPMSVGQLLTDGWEIAGVAPSLALVGSVIVFKHRDRNYLVQCATGYDATRGPREHVVINCYELR